MQKIRVNAFWDDEAKVFVATSDDVPGLVAEANDMDSLVEELKCMIPELLELNNVTNIPEEIPFKLHSEIDVIAHAC